MRKFLIAAFAVLTSFSAVSQDFSNKGKDFWLAYSYHVGMINTAAGPPTMTLYLTSDVSANYTVDIYGVGTITNGTILPNQVIPVNIPNAYFIDNEGIFNGKAIHVTSNNPIVVYSYITRSQASGATLCLPTNVLGKEYYSSNFTQNSNEANSNSYFTIIAVEDNTSVEIIPTSNTKNGWLAYSTHVVNLNKGQIYQVLGTTSGNTGSDLSGSSIKSIALSGQESCKKIAVFSGAGKINIACTGGSADNLYQQLYPASSWGKKYLTVPSYNRPNNYYRIYRNDPATNVYLNGTLIPAGSFSNNYYQFNNNATNLVEADKPITMAQYFTSQGCGGNSNSSLYDPDMIILNPVEQNISKVTLISSNLAAAGTHEHYLHVIMKNSGTAISSFRYDGVVPPGTWTVHPRDPNYSYLYITATETSHTILSDSGFNALAYGFANAESYGYSAGTNVKDLYQQVGVATQYGIEPTPSVCTGSPFKFKISLPYLADSIFWDLSNLPATTTPVPASQMLYYSHPPVAGDADSSTVVNGKTIYWYSFPTTYTVSPAGTYHISITAYAANADGCGNSQDIDFDLGVFDPPTPAFNASGSGCVAEPVQFTDLTPANPKPTYKWFWNFGDPSSGVNNTSNLKNPTHLFSAPGNYTVSFSNITTPGCISNTITQQVFVPALPSATISGNSNVCQNATPPNITFTGTDGTPPYTFSYNINGGPTQTIGTTVGTSVTLPVPTNASGTFIYNLLSVKNTGSTLCTQPQSGTATVVVNPEPSATISGATAVCQNASAPQITFTGSNATAPYTFTYNINGGASQTITTVSGNSISISVPTGTPGSYTYNLLSVQESSTSACSKNMSGSATVTVNELPTATISGTTSLCANQPSPNITFTGALGTAPYTFSYNINGGATLTISTTVGNSVSLAVPTGTPGTFVYNLLSVKDASATLCSQSQAGSATVIVNPVPVISNIAHTDPTVCTGTDGTITLSGLTAGTTYTVNYDRNGSPQTALSLTANAAGQVVITGLNAATYSNINCSAAGCTSANAASQVLTDPNAPNAPTAGYNGPICSGTTLNLTASPNSPGVTTYAWTGPGGFTSSTQNPVIPSAVNGGIYSVTATINNCTSVAGTINVIINLTPAITSITKTDPTTCSGTEGTITINGLTAGQTFVVNYKKNGTPQTPVSLTANAAGSVTITGLTAGTYSNINCSANNCTSADGATQVLTDPAPPNAPTAGYNSPVCSGTTLNLTATPNSPGTTTYTWSGPGGFTSSLQNPSIAAVTVAQSGTYQVFATVNNCISLVAGTVNVNIIQSPVISTITKTDPTTCTGTEGTITINGLVAGQTYTVNYSKNGTAQTPLTLTANAAGSVTITGLGAGNYTNINVTYNGCTSANGPAQVLSDPNPPLAPTASGSTPICSGTTLTLNAVPNSAGATTYTWTGPNSFSSTSQNPTIPSVTTLASGIYTVTATVNNCVSGPSNNVNIQVNLTPDISSVSFSNPTTCSGSDGTITLNGLTAGTTFTVNYKKNGTAQTALTLTANASGSVTITGLSAGTYSNINCTASSCTGADAPTQVLTDPNPPAQPTGSTITSPVCEGQTLSFSTPAVAGAIYTWTGPNAFSSSLQNPSISNATPAATGNYSIVVTVNNCVSQAFIIPVTVNANPTAVINNSTPVCESSVISFTDASVPNSGVVNGWSWNFGDPASGANNTSTLQNPVHTFSGLSNYNVTLTVTTDKGCSSTQATKNITVNVNPKAGFMVPEVCLNDVDATFTDTSSIPSGSIVNWSWDFGDPGSGALNFQNGAVHNGVHKYTATGNYTVKLTVTSNTGCTNVITHDIFINGANPTANFSVANAAAICSNDSVSITNLSTVAPGVVTKLEIFWDNVNAPLPSGTEYVLDDNPTPGKIYKHKYASFQSPLTKNFTIRMRAYSGTLCVNDKLVVITVNATPKVQFNNMPDVCYDAAPFQITQASEIGGVPGTGTFSGPGVSPTGIFNPTAAGIGTFTIKYTYASTAAGCIDSMSKTIRVLDSATAKFIVSPPVCETKTVSFTEASTAPAGVTLTNTVFDFGDGSPLQNQAPGSTFTHTYAAAGNYTVKMYNTSSAGCKSTTASTVVHVNPQARPNFTFPASVCLPNASVLFTNTSTIADGTENSFTYLWNFGDPASGANNTSVAKNPTHVYITQASYSVKLEVVTGAGCYHDTTIVFNNIHPQPKADFTISNPGGVCIGDPVTFTDITNPLDGTTVSRSWDLGDGSLRSAPSVTYTYGVANTFNVKLFITNSQGCNSDTMTKAFTVHPYPVVDAGPDRYILEGGTITLQPSVSGNDLQYLWLPATFLNNNAIATPNVVKPTTDMTYTLLVTARGGCSRSDNVFVKLLKFPVIPNTFTPNNDGINDFWSIDYLDTYPGNRVQVFNRYGQLVFESYGYSKPWDGTYKGKTLPIGTYYYIIEPKNGREPLTGYVTIIK